MLATGESRSLCHTKRLGLMSPLSQRTKTGKSKESIRDPDPSVKWWVEWGFLQPCFVGSMEYVDSRSPGPRHRALCGGQVRIDNSGDQSRHKNSDLQMHMPRGSLPCTWSNRPSTLLTDESSIHESPLPLFKREADLALIRETRTPRTSTSGLF